MARSYWLMLASLLFTASMLPAATKGNPPPDKEMLQIMDFLKDIDVIRQMDMMQELQNVEYAGDQLKGTVPKKSPEKKKETTK
jgi:hypothetical protein